VLLAITVADCIPIYLVVPQKRVVALLHAGWRGTAGGILERGVELLKGEASAAASDIVMHCGIGICGSCYEVGSEVLAQLGAGPEAGSGRVDLRDRLARRAERLGLSEVTCLAVVQRARPRAVLLASRVGGARWANGRLRRHTGGGGSRSA